MGCSGANVRERTIPLVVNGKKRISLEERSIKYHKNHENFETIMLDAEIRNNFLSGSEREFVQFFEQFYVKYKVKFDKYNMLYDDVKDVMLEKLAESQIGEDLFFKEWDMHKIFSNIIEDQSEITEDKADLIKSFFLSTTRYFPAKQKGCMAVLEGFENVQKWGLKYYLANLKFNVNFQMEVFIIILSPFIFQDEENIIDICEVIDRNPNLTTVSIVLLDKYSNDQSKEDRVYHNYEPEKQQLLWISYIFQSIKNNSNIKAFSYANYSNYTYNLPLETISILYQIISLDQLIAIALIKLNFSSGNIKEIFKIIGKLDNLKFFVFDVKVLSPDCIPVISDALIKNKRIIGSYLVLGENLVDKDSFEKNILDKNRSIKYLELAKEFIFLK